MSILKNIRKDSSCILCYSAERGGTWRSRLVSLPEDKSVYGVLYEPTIALATSACTRNIYSNLSDKLYLVNTNDIPSLPAHNFKKCVVGSLAGREVNYFLDSLDSTKRVDGSASVLTGEDGDVMVEIPITYRRIETLPNGGIVYLVADHEFEGATPFPYFYVSPNGDVLRKQYVGAYQSTLCDASGARIANMMNQDTTEPSVYVAGYKARSVAGCKPWVNMTQAIHREAAANNGGFGINSLFQQYLMTMMLIEGGSFDMQTTISPGFVYASASDYAFTRLSGRANFGNGTGNILVDSTQDAAITWQSVADALKVVQFSYRGIENPYGEIWKFEDGIQKYQNVVEGALTDGCYWWTAATSKYTDVDQNAAESPVYTRVSHAWPASGWAKTWSPNSFFPLAVGGGSGTYMCDYFYNDAAAGARVVLRGGRADNGAYAGVGCVFVIYGLAFAFAYVGGRLAC